MKIFITASWTVEVETENEAHVILDKIEETAAREGCELDSSSVQNEDENQEDEVWQDSTTRPGREG